MSGAAKRQNGPPAGGVAHNSASGASSAVSAASSSSAQHTPRARPAGAPPRGSDNGGKVIGPYMLGKTIGEGTFGKVKIAVHAPTGERVAVKILEKSRIKDQADVRRVNREIKILKKARHTNVIQLYEVIDTSNAIYLIMESCDGGEMFDYIVRHRYVQEIQACKFFHQIIDGVEALHRSDITHRDLKPENLLLTRQQQQQAGAGAPEGGLVVKIVDFGLSNTHEGNRLLTTACGSPCYAAPEMIAGHHYVGPIADMWSIGVILFALLCGYLPFEDPNTAQLYRKILSCQYKPAKWISPEARDLISKILEVDPTKRYTPAQIRMHPWYNIVPESAIPRDLAHAASTAEQFRKETLAAVERAGFDAQAVHDAVKSNMCNSLSALYYLFEKSLIHNRGAKPKDSAQSSNPVGAARQQQGIALAAPQTTSAVPPLQISHIQQVPRNIKPIPGPSRPSEDIHSTATNASILGVAKVALEGSVGANAKASAADPAVRTPRNPHPPPKVPLRPQGHGSRPHHAVASEHSVPVPMRISNDASHKDSAPSSSEPVPTKQNTAVPSELPAIEYLSTNEKKLHIIEPMETPDINVPPFDGTGVEVERPVTRRSHLRTPGRTNRPSTVEKGEFDAPKEAPEKNSGVETINTVSQETAPATTQHASLIETPTILQPTPTKPDVDGLNARAPEAPKSSLPTGGRRGKNLISPSISVDVVSNATAVAAAISSSSADDDAPDVGDGGEVRGPDFVNNTVTAVQAPQQQKTKFLNFGARFISSGGPVAAPPSTTGAVVLNPKEQAAQNRASSLAGSIGPGAGAVVI